MDVNSELGMHIRDRIEQIDILVQNNNSEKLSELLEQETVPNMRLYINTQLYNLKNQYQEIIKLESKFLNLSQSMIKKKLIVILSHAHAVTNNYREAINHLDQLIDDFPDKETDSILELTELKFKRCIYQKTVSGDNDKILQTFINLLSDVDNTTQPKLVADINSEIGLIKMKRGRNEEAESYFRSALDRYRENEDKQGIGSSMFNISTTMANQGKLEEAFEMQSQCLAIFRGMDWQFAEAAALNNMGGILKSQGRLLNAIKYYKTALQLNKKLDEKERVAIANRNIGEVMKLMGSNNEALNYFLKAYTIYNTINSPNFKSSLLRSLTSISSHLDKGKADEYYSELQQLSNDHPTDLVKQNFNYVHASKLAESNRLLEQMKAQEILKNEIDKPIVDNDSYIEILMLYFDLLLVEYSKTSDKTTEKEIYAELSKVKTNMAKMAEAQNSAINHANYLIMEVEIALIKQYYDQAHNYLEELKQFLEEANIHIYSDKVNQLYDLIDEQAHNKILDNQVDKINHIENIRTITKKPNLPTQNRKKLQVEGPKSPNSCIICDKPLGENIYLMVLKNGSFSFCREHFKSTKTNQIDEIILV